MLLSDGQIAKLCADDPPLITPFAVEQVREIDRGGVAGPGRKMRAISYGLSSYGYDFTLASTNFKTFRHELDHTIVDPKNFDKRLLSDGELRSDNSGDYFIIPGNSYGLGETLEWVSMPRGLAAIGVGKSTYARCGLIVNVTPLEPEWRGRITLEIANACSTPIKVYAHEGICQFMFVRGERLPQVSYSDRRGKYQDHQGATLAQV
jgi:dCTP deaminase